MGVSVLPRGWGVQFGIPGGDLAVLAVVAVAIAVLVLGLRELSAVGSPHKRIWLGFARLFTLMAALLVVLQPQWTERTIKRVEGKLAVVADVSRSMSVRIDRTTRRADLAKQVAARWAGDDAVAPFVYAFGREARPADLGELAEDYPTGDEDTRLGAALSQVVQEQGDALGAIVVLSDGADLSEVSPLAAVRNLGVRVHAVFVGDEAGTRDEGIVRVRADPVAFLRQEAQVEVGLRRQPARAGSIMVSLRQGGEIVREIEAQLDADGRGSVTIPFPVTQLGRSVYTVSIPLSGDDAVPENNERAFLINATRDRLRVLLVCGHPSWDARFLRAFLKDNPGNDLITFFILRTPSDMSMAAQSELSLIPFPTDELFREHLESFDLVIFQDFNYGPYQMAQYLPRVRDYVMRGGAFAMIGGNLSFGAGQYERTPLADVLPVHMAVGADAFVEEPFRPHVAPGLDHHPIVELLPDALDNENAWARLSPVPGQNSLLAARDGAVTLLQHPEALGNDGKPMPTLVVGESGKGRVLALATDGSWRWGMATAGSRGDASAYERFWDRSLRWLARDPMLDPSRAMTDRERYAPEATMEVDLSLRDAQYVPLGLREVEVLVLDGDMSIVQQVPARTDLRGQAQLKITAPPDVGGYQVAVRMAGQEQWIASEGFVVEAGGDELADPRPNAEVLRGLSEATGGEFSTSGGAPALASFDRTRSQELGVERSRPFATGWFFALLCVLFTAEWILRRRWGLR